MIIKKYAHKFFFKTDSSSDFSSIKSNTSNDINISLVSEKRREVADQLFQSTSDFGTKKKSLNETIKSHNSSKV